MTGFLAPHYEARPLFAHCLLAIHRSPIYFTLDVILNPLSRQARLHSSGAGVLRLYWNGLAFRASRGENIHPTFSYQTGPELTRPLNRSPLCPASSAASL